MLYQKALRICLDLEEDSKCYIDKIDELSFFNGLERGKRKKLNQSLSINSYLNDYEDLYWELVFLIAKEPRDVYKAFASLTKKLKEDPKSISSSGWLVVNSMIINQFGTGDNVAGDKR